MAFLFEEEGEGGKPRIGKKPKKNKRIMAREFRRYGAVVVTYCPQMSGYWMDYEKVFILSIYSMINNTSKKIDLYVIDNGSCSKFRDLLYNMHRERVINFLYMSDKNLGKVGALNLIIPSIKNDYIIFSDGDIYFKENWLEKHITVYNAFSKICSVGMVTGSPFPTFDIKSIIDLNKYCLSNRGVEIITKEGFPKDLLYKHLHDIGRMKRKFIERYSKVRGYIVRYKGIEAYVGARHLEFLMPKDVARTVFPVEISDYVMNSNDVRRLDEKVMNIPSLKLSTVDMNIRHIGNFINEEWLNEYAKICKVEDSKSERFIYKLKRKIWRKKWQ